MKVPCVYDVNECIIRDIMERNYTETRTVFELGVRECRRIILEEKKNGEETFASCHYITD